MSIKPVPFREWAEMLPAPRATYKDMEIVDITPIGNRFVLLTLEVPLPRGGIYEECVSIDTHVDVVSDEQSKRAG